MKQNEKQKAFLELFKPVEQNLYRYARAMADSNEEAKDLAADTVLAAYEGFESLKHKEAFLSYLFTIASRIAKKKRWRKKFFGVYNEIEANQMPDLSQNADRNIDIDLLYKALGQLPAKQKEALVLFEISGFSLKEIQEMQGGSLSAVKSRISRGREKLGQLLQENKDPNLTVSKININTVDRLKLLRIDHEK